MTVYTGPILGKDKGHTGACAKRLIGTDEHAMVAVSTRYLNRWQGGWESTPGACGQCMVGAGWGVDRRHAFDQQLHFLQPSLASHHHY